MTLAVLFGRWPASASMYWSALCCRPGAAPSQVARVDALRAARRTGAGSGRRRVRAAARRIGERVAAFYLQQGWQQRSLRADLAVLDRGSGQFLATKVILAAAGLFFGPFLFSIAWTLGVGSSPVIPVWLALLFAAVFFLLPDVGRAGTPAPNGATCAAWWHVLDLVAMNLAGGRGLPEALMAAADQRALGPVADPALALADARLSGTTQWAALGVLGTDIGVDELNDLSASLSLVADDGAKIPAVAGRSGARTLRRRELAEVEGGVGEKSQSMLVAQLLICFSFMIFLAIPALAQLRTGQ